MIVVLLGPPGVGKGTQGVLLARRMGWRHVATGDLLRNHRRQGTELGRKARVFMDDGELVPDHLIMEMVREVLASMEEEGVVFDGFPRTVPQAEGLDAVLAREGADVGRVVVLVADDETIVERLSGRRSCPQCGAVYNVNTNPPEQPGRCDECGDRLRHREDDRPETIRRRLDVYREETAPLVRHYEEGDAPVRYVDGEGSVEDVHDAVVRAVTGGGRRAEEGASGAAGATER